MSAHDLAGELATARMAEVDAVAALTVDRGVVGVTGPAGTGKSAIVRAVCARRQQADSVQVAFVDLAGAWSVGRASWLFLRAGAIALIGEVELARLGSQDRGLQLSDTRSAEIDLIAAFGREHTEALLRSSSLTDDHEVLRDVIGRVAALAERPGGLLMAIDHLESPGLSFRHPLDVGRLLWTLRGFSQASSRVRVMLCGRPGARRLADETDGAYHQDGTWLTISPPNADVWSAVTHASELGIPAEDLSRIVDLTRGQPYSTLRVLGAWPRTRTFDAAVTAAAAEQLDAVRQVIALARSVHRLGPPVLLAVARGDAPYGIAGGSAQRALPELEAHGLIARDAPREWRVSEAIWIPALTGAPAGALSGSPGHHAQARPTEDRDTLPA